MRRIVFFLLRNTGVPFVLREVFQSASTKPRDVESVDPWSVAGAASRLDSVVPVGDSTGGCYTASVFPWRDESHRKDVRSKVAAFRPRVYAMSPKDRTP